MHSDSSCGSALAREWLDSGKVNVQRERLRKHRFARKRAPTSSIANKELDIDDR
jgi:hypothetical protein